MDAPAGGSLVGRDLRNAPGGRRVAGRVRLFDRRLPLKPTFDYAHVVTFDETNVVGNVYFVHYLRWQGHCRELFLQDHAPGVLAELQHGLALVTTHCSCDYFAELLAFDQIVVRMSLAELSQHRLTMRFDYVRVRDGGEELVARGEQQIACLRRDGAAVEPVPVPGELRDALEPYAARELA